MPVGSPTSGGWQFPALGADGQSAFYVVRRKEPFDVIGPPIAWVGGERIDAACSMADGRKATIAILPDSSGAVRVRFAVERKGEFEKLGVRLGAGEEEGFYGLMERVIQGNQGLSWGPGITDGLNLRGQVVDLYALPTVSLVSL